MFSGRDWPKNIPGYANSSEYLSLKTLNGLLPPAGATFGIFCFSLSSKKSVPVSMVSVTPAGVSSSSSLDSYSHVSELTFTCLFSSTDSVSELSALIVCMFSAW